MGNQEKKHEGYTISGESFLFPQTPCHYFSLPLLVWFLFYLFIIIIIIIIIIFFFGGGGSQVSNLFLFALDIFNKGNAWL